MKKYFTVAALVVLLGLTTGCGKTKVLKCSMTSDETGATVEDSINATFKGKELSKVDFILNYIVEKDYTSYIDEMMTDTSEQFESEFGDKKGVVIKSDKTSEGFSYKVSVNFSKADDETIDGFGLGDKTAKYEDTKKELEEQGYTCK